MDYKREDRERREEEADLEQVETERNMLKKGSNNILTLIRKFIKETGTSRYKEVKTRAEKLLVSKNLEQAENGGTSTDTTAKTHGLSPEKEKLDMQETEEEGEVTIE